MKVTKQETVVFSKGRCCFVRFECDGTSDRALLREEDALELVAAWNTRTAPALTPKQAAADEMFEALTQEFVSQNCTCNFLNYVGQEPPCGKCKLGMLLAKAGQP